MNVVDLDRISTRKSRMANFKHRASTKAGNTGANHVDTKIQGAGGIDPKTNVGMSPLQLVKFGLAKEVSQLFRYSIRLL